MNDSQPVTRLLLVGDEQTVAAVRAAADAPEQPLSATQAGDLADGADGERYGIAAVADAGDPAATVERLRERDPELPVVVVARGDRAAAALAAGATTTVPPEALRECPETVVRRLAGHARERAPPTPFGDGRTGLIESLPEMVAVVDPVSGELLSVNGRYAEFYGYDRHEIRARGFEGPAAPGGGGRTPAEAVTDLGEGTVTVEWAVQTAVGAGSPRGSGRSSGTAAGWSSLPSGR